MACAGMSDTTLLMLPDEALACILSHITTEAVADDVTGDKETQLVPIMLVRFLAWRCLRCGCSAVGTCLW